MQQVAQIERERVRVPQKFELGIIFSIYRMISKHK